MENLNIAIALSNATLAFSGIYTGSKFLQRRNQLLGWEWIILGVSASNAIVYFMTSSQVSFEVMVFLDAFSRTIGVPIIGALGILSVTQRINISDTAKNGLFAFGATLSVMITAFDTIEAWMPTIALWMTLIYVFAQLNLSIHLFRNKLIFHSFAVFIGMVVFQLTSLADGVLESPKGPTTFIEIITNFWVYSNVVWAIMFAEIYYACAALQDKRNESRSFVIGQ